MIGFAGDNKWVVVHGICREFVINSVAVAIFGAVVRRIPNHVVRKIEFVPASRHRASGLPAANGVDDFNAVAMFQFCCSVLASGDDFEIDLHRQAFAFQPQFFDELSQRSATNQGA